MPMYTTCVSRRPGVEQPRGADHLPDDLARAEVALEPHRAREAEGAREAAADLGGHAEREPVAVGHQHRLHARPVGEAKTIFSLPSCDGVRAPPRGTPTNARSDSARRKSLRQIGHGVDVDGTLLVDPRRELAPAIPRRPERLGERLELGRQEIEQVDGGHTRHRIAQALSTASVGSPWISPWVTMLASSISITRRARPAAVQLLEEGLVEAATGRRAAPREPVRAA